MSIPLPPTEAPGAYVTRAPFTERLALRLLQTGIVLVVLVAAPYKLFDLDRFFVPKELVLHLCALTVAVLCLVRARRFALQRVDEMLALFLALGIVSAVFATNWWLAGRAVALSVGGALCFWCARALGRAGYSRAVVSAVALAGAIGAATALLQAHGLRIEYMSLNRAPGGTFGNRNFMAHLCVIALPALLLTGMRARTRPAVAGWCGALALVGGALVLSRSRAAWLALLVGTGVVLVAAFIAFRVNDRTFRRRRVILLGLALAAGGALSLVLPNTLDWKSDSPYMDTASSIVNYKGGSGQGRLIQYGNSLRMSLHHPLLGVGPGNWPVVYPRFASEDDPSLGSEGMTSNPWPSSDWVTFVSERGAAALVVLALAVLSLLLEGIRALRTGESTDDRLSAATLLGTVATLVVVGSFDAVLLLPVAALAGWALLGVLAPAGRVRRVIELTTWRRILAIAGVLVLEGLAVWRSGSQLGAMAVYSSTSKTRVLEQASTLDPGSFRIHVRLADAYARRGDCRKARPHASAARAQFPEAPAPRRLLASCGR